MNWTVLAGILGCTILLGGAVKALSPVWVFTKACLTFPITIERMYKEFRPNGGGSMRDAIDVLTTDSLKLWNSNREILERLDGVDVGLEDAKSLAKEVKHDLAKFNEMDQLGREGRLERRYEGT